MADGDVVVFPIKVSPLKQATFAAIPLAFKAPATPKNRPGSLWTRATGSRQACSPERFRYCGKRFSTGDYVLGAINEVLASEYSSIMPLQEVLLGAAVSF
jgi:hypothetical protein